MIRRPVLVVVVVVAAAAPACSASDVRPDCVGAEAVFTLAAQAVPSATLLPCLDALLTGWEFGGSQIVDGTFRFWLGSDRAGLQAVQVELVAECDTTGAIEVVPSPDEAGTRRFEKPLSLGPSFAADRYYRFPGGCVEIEYRFGSDDSTLVLQADQAISFRSRQELVERLEERELVLCGAGALECAGGD